jgi:hypothetical protein
MSMTIDQLEAAVWDANATVKLVRVGKVEVPVVERGELGIEAAAALVELREEVVERMRGTRSARWEGLVCCLCDDEIDRPVLRERVRLRECPVHGAQLHYPRA